MRLAISACGLAFACFGPAAADAPPSTPLPPDPPAQTEATEDSPPSGVDASEAPAEMAEPPTAPDPSADHEVDEPTGPVAVAPPETGPAEADLDSCIADLREIRAEVEQAEPLTGEGPCGAKAPVTLARVGKIALEPAVTLRCPAVRAIARWVDRVVAPMADLYLESSLKSVTTSTTYQCRKRRGDGTAKWSEHAFANAIDVIGVRLDDGTRIGIAERAELSEKARAFQAGIRGGACAFFTTVLGPATNSAHSDHLHMDMAERTGGYRLCE